MSAAARLPAIASTVGVSALIASLTRLPRIRALFARYIGEGTSTKMWRIAALALALLNLKNVPGFWHIRVLRGIVYQLFVQPTPPQPQDLFKPLITSSRNTPYDCDYNLHKSNSTYFADLDVARAHAVSCVIRTGLARLNRGDDARLPADTRNVRAKYGIALGAVACFFQRQIDPFQPFEIHTRVLGWDRKWLYLVSHIVEKGAIRPERYALQPWKRGRRKAGEAKTNKEGEDAMKHIFATSVARYVFKKGRLTINPEVVLERSRLLPPRPAGVGLPPRSEEVFSEAPTPATNGQLAAPENVATEASEKLASVGDSGQQGDTASDWTWEDMERERLRGLKMAQHLDALSGAHKEMRSGEALGQYSDYW